MKVLVLGSTGYLGNPIAEALVRAGHLVYAQTRSAKNVARLAAQELVPFVSDPNTDDKYLELISALKVDVVIEALGDYGGTLLVEVFNKICKAAKEARSPAYKLTYIAISGGWAHGTQPPASLVQGLDDERGQPSHPAHMMIPRVAAETNILTSSDVDGIVIRPSLFYGRAGGVWGPLFERATEAGEKGETFEWYINEGGRFTLAHVDDIAQMALKVAEHSPICKHLVFDCANPITEPQPVFLDKLAALTGANGWVNVKPTNDFERAMISSNTIRPGLARALVGWEARKPSFTDGLDIYYASWKAARK